MVLVLGGSAIVAACSSSPATSPAADDAGPSPTHDAAPQQDATPEPLDAGPEPTCALQREDPPAPAAGSAGAAPGLSMNAVSVLFPHEPETETGLLRLDSAANGGPLLSTDMFNAAPEINRGDGGRAYAKWRVVAARIDPCFPTLAFLQSNPSACRRQLRLVAQPVMDQSQGGDDDAAIHIMFDLTEAQFADLAQRWTAPLKNQVGGHTEALGVSPTLTKEGLGGAYATLLKGLIKEFGGPTTLSQVTFMDGRFANWQFGGFRVHQGVRTRLEIFGVQPTAAGETTQLQATVHDPGGFPSFAATPTSPTLTILEGLNPTALPPVEGEITGGGRPTFRTNPAAMQAGIKKALEVDNPLSGFHADSLDCSSCHVAGRARRQAESHCQTSPGSARYMHAFRPGTPAGNIQTPLLSNQRAFGYLRGVPSINGRVVHESAEVADYIEANLLKP